MGNRLCAIAAMLLLFNHLMLHGSTAAHSPVLLQPSPTARSLLSTAGTPKVTMMHPDDCALLLEWPEVSRALGVTACNGSVACDFCSKDGHIEYLRLSDTNISGPLPGSWGRMANLSYLSLSNTNVSGPLPGSWGRMTNLSGLYLTNTSISGPLPDSWGRMTNLSILSLSNTSISGPLPDSWGQMTKMMYLYLSDTNISGPLPASWGRMANLSALGLFNTNISGPLPGSWGGMEKLSYLDLSNTNITGTLPESWHRNKFRGLRLANTNISGQVSMSWIELSTHLDLSNTSISGPLPSGWGSLAGISVLWNLSSTDVSGALPDSWGRMESLVTMDLCNTRVSGTLPSNWRTMPGLVHLDLSNTSVHGSIPDSWTQKSSRVMKQLRYLSVPFSKRTVTPAFIDRVCSANTLLKLRIEDKEWDFNGGCASNLRSRRTIATAILAAFAALLLACLVHRCCCCRKGHTCSLLHLCQTKLGSCCTCFHRSNKLDQQKPSFLKRCSPLLLSGTWLHVVAIFFDFASDIWVVYQVAPRTGLDVTVDRQSNELTPHFRLFLCLVVFLFAPDLVASVAAWSRCFAVYAADSGLIRTGAMKIAAGLLLLPITLPFFVVSLHISLLVSLTRSLFSMCTSSSNSQSTPKQPSVGAGWPCHTGFIMAVIHPVRYKELVGLLMACTEDVASIAITTVFFLVNRQKYGKTLRTPAYVINVLLSMAHVLWETWVWAPRLRQHGVAAIGRAFCFKELSGHAIDSSASEAVAAQKNIHTETACPTSHPVPGYLMNKMSAASISADTARDN